MDAFETTAIVEDASHLTLRSPVPFPVPQECRVIVLVETPESQNGENWPARFFHEIGVTDPAFARPAQGGLPPVPALTHEGIARHEHLHRGDARI